MPNTSLALQLKKLQAPQTQLLIHRKKKDSFLFDPKEAAKFDRDDIYELGLSGLEELKKFNPNFSAFDNTLFDVTSKFFERSVESSEANEKLNDQIKTFLTLLCPYFLLKPAHKALEWLINRYHINKFNDDDIMFLILPYHETVLFSRMLQLIRIEKDTGKWHWLYNVKKRGVPLSKTALLNRASKDMGFLKFVCDMPAQAIKIHGSRASSLVTLFAFYCTTVIGGLQYADPINELHITHILPSVLAALSSSLLDYTASGFMIIARLATKTCLSPKVLTILFNKISKVKHAKLRSETALVFVLLCQNNEGKCDFPEKAAARIAEAPWFISSLATLNKSGIVIRPFLCLLLTTCLKRIQDGEEIYKVFIQKMLTDVKYKSDTAEQIFKILLDEFSGESSDETIKWFSELIKELEHSFPQVFDSVISAALSDEQSKAGVAVKIILGINTSRNDLFLKLVHPNEDVRLQAIKHIGKHFEPDQVAWLSQSLLDRLKDDSPKVVRQFLRLPSAIISSLSKDVLVNNLLLVIARFSSTDEPIVLQAITILINNTTSEQEVVVLIAILPFIIPAMYKSDIIENAPADRLEFLSILKSNATRETNADVVLRESLANSCVLPPVQVVFSTLMETKPLKSHSAFWFSAALLIGSKITEHPSQENAELVMNFLTEFLRFPELDTIGNIEEIDENNLLIQSCFESSIKRKLPIQGALYCLSNLSECISQHSFTRKPWLDPKNKSNVFTLSVYKVLHEGCNSNFKAVRVAFSQAQISFFKNHFPDTEFQILFLLNASMLDSHIGSKSLNWVIKMLNDDSSLIPSILKEQSLVVPSLLMLLESSDETMRSKTLKILGILTDSLSTGFYRPLVEELINYSTEILLDHEQIQIFAYEQLSPSKEIKSLLKETLAISMGNVLHHLISIITNVGYPLYIKVKLLRILKFVCSKEIFLELFPVAIQLLGSSEELDEEESYLVLSIFKRLNHSMPDVFNDEKFWNSLRIALTDSKTIVLSTEQEKGICPAALILNQVSKELFDELGDSNQEKLIYLILEKATDVENVQVINAAALFFKRISLDSKILLSLFTAMLNIVVPHSPNSLRARNRKSTSCLPSLETLETIEWKRGVCLLEFVQNKKKLSNIHLLLPIFFNLLKKCLQFEQQAPVEYVKQLLLSGILHACKKLSTGETLSVSLETLQVDVVVECVRASHNPQTHHHALLALSYIAHLIPDQVLHNMMAIFTFIGSSVVRQDDAYSFQLISKIIETIIPILVKSQKGASLEEAVTLVLRVFVDTILDLPEHRRIPLFKKLMVTLNDGEFLWIFLCLAFEKHVLTYLSLENEEKSPEMGSMPRVLSYALQLCAEFPPSVILKTSLSLLQYISKIPHDKGMYLRNKGNYKTTIIFSIEENTEKNFRHYKYTLLTFLSSLMSSKTFVQQVSELSDEETFELKNLFGSIVEQCLVYIKSASIQIEQCVSQPTAKYWKVVLNQCYDILDKVNALLPTEIFIEVVGRLLRNPFEAVRRKAMELLGWKLQQPTPLLLSQLRELLDPLVSVLDSLHSQTLTNTESTDSLITQQAALFSLKLMTRHLCSTYIDDFLKVLEKVTDILAFDLKPSGPVFGSLVLCLGELVSMTKMHSLSFLPKFMPPLMSALHDNLNENGNDILLLSIVTTVQKIVEVIPQFLSPYLGQLLFEVCILSAKHEIEITDQQQKSLPLKLKSIRQKVSSEIAVRVLVPAVSSAHLKLLECCHYQAIGPLMTTLSDSFTSASDLSSETIKLFLSTLEFRSIHPEPSLAESESVENPVIVAFTKLILKLSESSFRPLYQRIFDWATRKKAAKERIITFYRLSHHLSNSLKSLFPLFLGIFIENAAEVLKKNNPAKQSEAWFSGNFSTEKSILVVENIVLTFFTTFTHDSQKCLTRDYFNLIMEPLVDQLENRSGGNEIAEERCKNIVIPCLASMASSTGDDSLWKRLNHQILLKTRHSSPEVRMLGLKATCSLAAKLGEDFMPLLPETVPFLAELLEDDVEEVEYECQKVVNEMEEILGESIQKYF